MRIWTIETESEGNAAAGIPSRCPLAAEGMPEQKRVQAVVFDWAGTTVDYGCMAPVTALLRTFEAFGVELEPAEVREPMGLSKREHIQWLCSSNERLRKFWRANMVGIRSMI